MLKMFSTITLFGVLAVSAAYAESNQRVQAHVPVAAAVKNTALPALNHPSSDVSYVPPRMRRQAIPQLTAYDRETIYKLTQVNVEVQIDKRGRVTEAHIVNPDKAISLSVTGASLTAAKQSLFQPAMLRGKNVASTHTVLFTFHPHSY